MLVIPITRKQPLNRFELYAEGGGGKDVNTSWRQGRILHRRSIIQYLDTAYEIPVLLYRRFVYSTIFIYIHGHRLNAV
jgi:hypothetical protein